MPSRGKQNIKIEIPKKKKRTMPWIVRGKKWITLLYSEPSFYGGLQRIRRLKTQGAVTTDQDFVLRQSEFS